MAQNIIISTLDKIPNYTIVETKGAIHTADYYYKNFEQLKNQAQSLGCNAIINLRSIYYYPSNIYLIGEAVKLVKSKEEINEKGLKKESIEIVIERGKCSREQAIKALKECNGDITEALLAIDLNNK